MRRLLATIILGMVLGASLVLPLGWTASNVFLTVDNLIAGTNVTLNKTSTTVTINASGGGGGCSETGGTNNLACGSDATATGTDSTVVGRDANDNGSTGEIVIGQGSSGSSSGSGNVVIGYGASLPNSQFGIFSAGSSANPYTEVYFGDGKQASSHASLVMISNSDAGTSVNNRFGGDLIIASGRGTGTARGGSIQIKASYAGTASSTTHNNRMIRAKYSTETITLTDAATDVIAIDISSGEMTSGKLTYAIRASDGTDHQSAIGEVFFAFVNKGGTITRTVNKVNETVAVSSGTLSTTWSTTATTSQVTLRVTPSGSLSETTYTLNYNYELFTRNSNNQ